MASCEIGELVDRSLGRSFLTVSGPSSRRRRRWRGEEDPAVAALMHLSLLALLIQSSLSVSVATDTLRQGDSINDGRTLVSARRVFELGFFSPKGSTSSNRYVGIWYKNITDQTVVWVANRNKPVTDNSGALTLDSLGNLMILDGSGYSVTVLMPGSGKGAWNATLLDSGNLVLRAAGSKQALWQSFDYPTDTWLPEMRLGRKGRLNRLLTSWRTSEDPSPGDSIFRADGPTVSISQKGKQLWVGDLATFFGFNASNTSTFLNVSYFTQSETDEAFFLYNAAFSLNGSFNSYSPTRIVMGVEGQARLLVWTFRSWTAFWAAPAKYECEVPGYCGPNGLCNDAATPICNCLQGFNPDSFTKWDSGDWSGGCVRRNAVCGKAGADGFLRLQGLKQPPVLYYNFLGNSSGSILGCQDKCLANCSCTAYATAYENTDGCFMWFNELIGLRENYSPGTGLYVRLAASELTQSSSTATSDGGGKRKLLIALPVVFVTVLLCGAGLCCFLIGRKRQGDEEETGEELLLRDIGMDGAVAYKFVDVNEGGGERGPEIYVYSFSNVLAATDNFSDDNKLGEGGFGPVYKGKLPDGQEIAIKRLSTRSGQGLAEFKTEILLIARLQHKNLVRLVGCCIQGEERLLIYEYMSNKSLDFFLFEPERAAQLDWGRRMRIIEGIVQGLLYLHKYSRLTIIHRDLKASNILLDNDMNPKISDFGMARIFSSNEDQANTNRIVGTYGYMSPEYAMEGLFSIKSDVFSFGVMLLEIVSGRKNIGSHHHFPIPRSLLGYAWELWNAGKEQELADPSLGDAWPKQEVSRCIHVGLMCVQECADDRPTMAEVVTMLSNVSSSHQAPKQPAFLTGRPTTQENCSSNSAPAISTNEVTISEMEGR